MGLTLEEVMVQGVSGWRCSNGLVSVTLLPELGAKLSSLYDVQRGREWLWTSDQTPYAHHAYGTSYVQQADSGGWDECFPTVAASPDPDTGAAYPDHGELWSQRWETSVQHSADALTLHSQASGVQRRYAFERALTLRPASPTLELSYRVENLEDTPLPFIWSAHPLFKLTPGLRLRLPAGTRLHPYFAPAYVTLPKATPFPWPFQIQVDGDPVALDPLPSPNTRAALKVWSEPLAQGFAELYDREARLRMDFEPQALPQIALWLNAGGWNGRGGAPYANLALEPCIGQQDSVAEAAAAGRCAVLPAGAERRWTLKVTLGGSP
ncbi:hypothetical protein [Deinococcus sp.]|uniref:aldose epimerase family protein n=1 Tax=Deinococcus sp. TaxID=47478 RepID=UPI003CC64F2F